MTIRRKLSVAKIGEVAPGRTKTFRYGHQNGLLYNDNGALKAYVNTCTHMGGPVELAAGGTILRCRWHQAEFNPSSGEAIQGQAPVGTRLKPITLTEEGDQIFAVLELPDDPFA